MKVYLTSITIILIYYLFWHYALKIIAEQISLMPKFYKIITAISVSFIIPYILVLITINLLGLNETLMDDIVFLFAFLIFSTALFSKDLKFSIWNMV